MPTENLKFVVGADVNELLNALGQSKKSLGDFKDQLARFKTALDSATDPKSIVRLNKAIEASVAKIKTISSAGQSAAVGFQKLSTSSNSSALALQNFGRIAQDAPFGIIGITNNINPLLESFQRLKAETGSTGSALKSLVGGLAGAGGLGLAVSLATSALTFFALSNQGAGSSVEDLSGKIDLLKIDFDNAKESMDSFSASANALKSLRDVNFKINIPDESKRSASLFGFNLDDERIKLDKLIGQETAAFDRASNTFALMQNKGSNALNSLISEYGNLIEVKKRSEDLSKNDIQLIDAALEANKDLVDIQNKQSVQRIAIKTLTAQEVSDQIDIAKKEAERLKNLLTQRKVLIQLRDDLALINREQSVLGINADDYKKKLDLIESAAKTLVGKLRVKPEDTVINQLFGVGGAVNNIVGTSFLNERLKETVRRIKIGLRNEFIAAPFEPVEIPFKLVPIETTGILPETPNLAPIGTSMLNDLEQLAMVAKIKAAGVTKAIQDGLNVGVSALRFPQLLALAKSVDEQLAVLTQLIKSTVLTLFEGLGEALGTALATGGSFIKKALGGILPIMGQFLIDLGKAAILTSNLFLAIEASKTNPFTGIIAGIAAIAAGNILKNIKLPGFATGVRDFGGGLAMVGERGREFVQLPRGSNVIPAAQTAAIMNQQMVFIPDIRLAGQDIVIAFNRASATVNRNG